MRVRLKLQCRSRVIVEIAAAGFARRFKPDRRSLFERRSPVNRFSSSDRVSAPLRRSTLERLPPFEHLSSLAIALLQTPSGIRGFGEQIVKFVPPCRREPH